ncbi:unnamed protein product [Ostreobium quekettii]|uniref:Uncharacterized protein n=1 Tax=Ostreobium quekettii TaxID=121088 RepID=A0A8S1IV81_9CHLO|nr:unnamed protein product [Ostreobium quekettii]
MTVALCSWPQLKELYETSVELNKGRLIVHGVVAKADRRTRNNRVYPKAILQREVQQYKQTHINNQTAVGELDHPDYSSPYFKLITLANISHQVLSVKWKGHQLWGTVQVLDTPSGLLLRYLYSQGFKLGLSLRGWSTVRQDPRSNCGVIDSDFQLITFDFVAVPSISQAYVVPIQQRHHGKVPDQSAIVQLASLRLGALNMAKFADMPAAHNVLGCAFAKWIRTDAFLEGVLSHHGLSDASGVNVLVPSQHRLLQNTSAWLPSGCALLHGSYISHQDLVGRNLLSNTSGIRDLWQHMANFIVRATRNNLTPEERAVESCAPREADLDSASLDASHIHFNGPAASLRKVAAVQVVPSAPKVQNIRIENCLEESAITAAAHAGDSNTESESVATEGLLDCGLPEAAGAEAGSGSAAARKVPAAGRAVIVAVKTPMTSMNELPHRQSPTKIWQLCRSTESATCAGSTAKLNGSDWLGAAPAYSGSSGSPPQCASA